MCCICCLPVLCPHTMLPRWPMHRCAPLCCTRALISSPWVAAPGHSSPHPGWLHQGTHLLTLGGCTRALISSPWVATPGHSSPWVAAPGHSSPHPWWLHQGTHLLTLGGCTRALISSPWVATPGHSSPWVATPGHSSPHPGWLHQGTHLLTLDGETLTPKTPQPAPIRCAAAVLQVTDSFTLGGPTLNPRL